jgi:predicted NBD/HSP70 family sugar kinase
MIDSLIEKGNKDFILLDLGEKPSCSFVVGGMLIKGSQGKAGNIGNSFITTKSRTHTFSYFLSDNFLTSCYAKNTFAFNEPYQLEKVTLSGLVALSKESKAAENALKKYLEMVGLKISDLIHFTSPSKIFMTGKMVEPLEDHHIDFLGQFVSDNVLGVFEGKTKIIKV